MATSCELAERGTPAQRCAWASALPSWSSAGNMRSWHQWDEDAHCIGSHAANTLPPGPEGTSALPIWGRTRGAMADVFRAGEGETASGRPSYS